MRQKRSIVFFVLMLAITLFLMGFTQWRSQHRLYSDFELEFTPLMPKFHTTEEVENLLKQNWEGFPNVAKDTLDFHRIEQQIEQLPAVANVEVYATSLGTIGISVEERKPYLRVQGTTAYYLDSTGAAFALSKIHVFDVPLIIGDLNSTEAVKVVRFVQQLQQHSFWKNELISFEKTAQNYTLQLRSFPFEVEFGNTNQWQQKTKTLMAFCAYYNENNPQQAISKINLMYEDRVVASAF